MNINIERYIWVYSKYEKTPYEWNDCGKVKGIFNNYDKLMTIFLKDIKSVFQCYNPITKKMEPIKDTLSLCDPEVGFGIVNLSNYEEAEEKIIALKHRDYNKFILFDGINAIDEHYVFNITRFENPQYKNEYTKQIIDKHLIPNLSSIVLSYLE